MSMSILSGDSWWSVDDDDGDEIHLSSAGSSSAFTISTSQTMSSRKRRPGAARKRLASAKAADKKCTGGWQESIQAAAAANHRVWDRSEGWIDYGNTTKATIGDTVHRYSEATSTQCEVKEESVPLHIFAEKSKIRSNTPKTQSSDDNDFSFPVDWAKAKQPLPRRSQSTSPAKQRQQPPSPLPARYSRPPKPNKKSTVSRKSMKSPRILELAEPSFEVSPPSSPPANDALHKDQSGFRQRRTQSLSPPRGIQPYQQLCDEKKLGPSASIQSPFSGDEIKTSSSRSKGWVESMREATASLAEEGHSWNPRQGFANLDSNASLTDIIIMEGSSQTETQWPKERPPPFIPALAARRQRSSEILDKMIADRTKNDPPGRKESVNALIHEYVASDEQRTVVQQQTQLQQLKSEHDQLINISDRVTRDNNQSNLAKQQQQIQYLKQLARDHLPSSKNEKGSNEQQTTAKDIQSASLQEQIEVVFKSKTPGSYNAQQNYGIAALNFEEEEDYMLRIPTSPVRIKREKVGAEDLGLFPERSDKKDGNVSQVSPVDAKNRVNSNISPDIKTLNKPGGGSDGVNNTTLSTTISTASSDETAETSNIWSGSAADNDSFLQGSITSIARRQAERDVIREAQKKRSLRLSPRPKGKENIAWAAHAKKLSQNVRSSSEAGASESSDFRELVKAADQVEASANVPFVGASSVRARDFSDANPDKDAIFRKNNTTTNTLVPAEIVTAKSNLSAQSSVTAGWKTFLNKKVNAETVAAAKMLEQGNTNNIFRDMKEEKHHHIKKTVTFESDSRHSDLAESLLDSLFDFSTSDVKSFSSPERTQATIPENGKSPSSPYRRRLNNIKEKRRNFPLRHGDQPQSAQLGFADVNAITDSSGRSLLGSQMESPRDTSGGNASRNNTRSFRLETSPLRHADDMEFEETKLKSDESSFLKRLTNCRAPIAPLSQFALPKGQEASPSGEGKESPAAYQWYLKGKSASEKVDEMLSFLREREPIASCRRTSKNGTANVGESIQKPPNVDGGSSGADQSQQSSPPLTPRDEADELARARVEAMVTSLYYASTEGR